MLPVHVHIHSALRSLYTDSEELNCDYCELNICYSWQHSTWWTAICTISVATHCHFLLVGGNN